MPTATYNSAHPLAFRVAPDCLLLHVPVLYDDVSGRISNGCRFRDSRLDSFTPGLEGSSGVAPMAIHPGVISLSDDKMALGHLLLLASKRWLKRLVAIGNDLS